MHIAVSVHGLALEFVPLKYQTAVICAQAVKQNKNAIKFIKH